MPPKSDNKYRAPEMNELSQQIRENCRIHGFSKPGSSNISEKLMLVSDELSEAHEFARDGNFEDFSSGPDGSKPDGFPIEIADAIIRLLDIAAGFDIDIAEMIRWKMRYNESRPVRHGRNF